MSVEEIRKDGELLGILVRSSFSQPGISFFTPSQFSQQLALMNHPKGKLIAPHVHNPLRREVQVTQEVLVIRKGALRVDFYDQDKNYIESRIARAGDILLLATGGHGFEVLEDLEMVEVKQGPFVGEKDKSRFDGISAGEVKLPR